MILFLHTVHDECIIRYTHTQTYLNNKARIMNKYEKNIYMRKISIRIIYKLYVRPNSIQLHIKPQHLADNMRAGRASCL